MADRFDKFTERARRVLTLAQEEAQRFSHNYIGTEHLLLGLTREGEGVAAKVLANLGVELDNVRAAVEFIIGHGDRPVTSGEIGLTPRAKKVIELAVDEARRLNHHYIGTEHLLLGLQREGEGIAAGVLESLGVSLERLRAEMGRILSQSMPGGPLADDAPAAREPLPWVAPPRALKEAWGELRALTLEHNAAIAAQEYQRAATARDEERRLTRTIRVLEAEWEAARENAARARQRAGTGGFCVLFTGPAGAGKSTLAAAWCGTRERAVHIELDKVREMIVAGRADPQEPGELQAEQYDLSVAACCALARTFLEAGYDVALDDAVDPDAYAWYWRPALEGIEPHLAVVLPSLEETLRRAAGREKRVREEHTRAQHAAATQWPALYHMDPGGMSVAESLPLLQAVLDAQPSPFAN